MDRASKKITRLLDLESFVEKQRFFMLSLIALLGMGRVNRISRLKSHPRGDLAESRSSGD